MRCPLRQKREVLVNGLPALGVAEVTPLMLTVPHERVVTWVGVVDTRVASECPLAPAAVPGKNIANDAMAATARRPAGSRKPVRNVPVCGARTPLMPT